MTIRELPSGVTLAGAVEREVKSREEIATVLAEGSLQRATASTNMNQQSSRSHAIFTITLEQRKQVPAPVVRTPVTEGVMSDEDADDDIDAEEDQAADDYLIAKMHLVDLAGSERAKKTGGCGPRSTLPFTGLLTPHPMYQYDISLTQQRVHPRRTPFIVMPMLRKVV